MLGEPLAQRGLGSRGQCMGPNSNNAQTGSTMTTHLLRLEEEIHTPLRPIARFAEVAESARAAEPMLQAVKEYIEPLEVG